MKSSCAAFLVLLATAASAQVYKNVGPDGKVTFSDRPTPGSDAPPIIAKPVPPPPPAAPKAEAAPGPVADNAPAAPSTGRPGQRTPEEMRAWKASAKSGTRVEKPRDAAAPGSDPPGRVVDTRLATGVSKVMTAEYLVNQFREVCGKAERAGKYDSAAQQWRERHALLLERYRVVLRDAFTVNEQAKLHVDAENTARKSLNEVAKASASARSNWCDRSANDINNRVIDMVSDPAAGPVLMAYQPKAR